MKVRREDLKVRTGRRTTAWTIQQPLRTRVRRSLGKYFSIIGAGLALGLLLLPSNADAARLKLRTLAYQGSWGAFYDSAGKVCLMVNEARDHLAISYRPGDDHVSVQVSSPDWDVEDGEQYRIVMTFDGASNWTADGTGGHYGNDLPYVEMNLRNEIDKWTNEFIDSDDLVVTFPDSKASFSISLSGGRDVFTAFVNCVQGNLQNIQ